MHDIVYLCPSTPKGSCCWEGSQDDVVTHFEDNHKEYFLDTNSLDIDVSHGNEVHYLMNVMNETYLVQVKYAEISQIVEIKIRYLGSEARASRIFYYIEIMSGNFGFTSKGNGNGFEVVTTRNGAIYVDVQAIKVTCGRRILDTLVAWIHIENDLNQYAYKSLRRRQYDNKTLESKARESFKRLSSYRTSIRKKSIDGLETVQTINRILQERRKSIIVDTPDLYQKFIEEIVEEIFRDAMDEIEFKEYVLVNLEASSGKSGDTKEEEIERSFEDTTFNKENKEDRASENKVIIDVEEYKSQEAFLEGIGSIHLDIVDNEDSKINQSCFQEDVVSSVEVATHQIPHTEYIEDYDRNSTAELDDISGCEWLQNGHSTPDATQEKKIVRKEIRLSQAEEFYLSNLKRIRCRNCHIIMTPPIFMCSEGHSVCLTCKSLNCGICGIEITDITNTDLEDISRSIAHPCRFAELGCKEFYSCCNIRQHEIYCDHFKYKCPICCLHTGKYCDIKSHLKLLHPSTKIVEEYSYPFPRNSDFIFANKYGIFHCTAPLKVNSIEWTVRFCGLEPISFVCKVKITGKKTEKVYMLQRHEDGYKSIIFLDELKSLRLKDKNAVLYLSEY